MRAAPVLDRAAPFVFAVLALGSIPLLLDVPVPVSWSSSLLAVAIALGLVRDRATLRESLVALVMLGGVAIATVLPGGWAFELHSSLLLVRVLLIGWALVLWIPRPLGAGEPASHELPAWTGPALLAVGALVLAAADWAISRAGHSGFTDEILYVFQSRLFSQGRLRAPLPDELRPFLAIVNAVTSDNQIHAQYTPGWPLLLAGLTVTGLFRMPWLFGALAVAGTYRVARLVGGRTVAVFAAFALLVDTLFLRWTSGYLAHAATACCLVWMAACVLDAERLSGWRHWASVAAGGLFGGIAFATRPLTALTLGAAIWLWLCARNLKAPAKLAAMTAVLVLGALPPLIGFLWINKVTQGSATTLGYNAAHAGGHTLGFEATRVRFDSLGEPVLVTRPASPVIALRQAMSLGSVVLRLALPAGLLLPLLWMAWRAGFEWRAITLVFLLVPAGYFFWPTVTIRSLTELMPFIAIGVALALGALWQRDRAWTRWALAVIAVTGLVVNSVMVVNTARRARIWSPYLTRIEGLAAAGPVLLFVNRGGANIEGLYEGLWWFNARNWMGNVVVARDLGARNAELMSRFPSHTAYVTTWRSGVSTPDQVPLARVCGADRAASCDARAP